MDNNGTQICKACFLDKPISDFYYKVKGGRIDCVCKKCRIAGKVVHKSPTHKKCKHCGEEKPFSEYQKAGGGKWLQPYCKPCDAERKKKYTEKNFDKVVAERKKYYQNNKEVISQKSKIYTSKNIDKIRARSKRYADDNREYKRKKDVEYNQKNRDIIRKKGKERYYANHKLYLAKQKIARDNRTPEQVEAKKEYDRKYKQKNKERLAQWRIKNAEKIRERNRIWSNKKAATDINYRLKRNIRTRIRCALKPNNAYKVDTSEKLLGCTIDFFKQYFSSLFTDGMSWDRFMAGEIEIDHITPCKNFDLTKEGEQRKCFHYSNTQPLWMEDNMKKGIKTMEEWKKMIA